LKKNEAGAVPPAMSSEYEDLVSRIYKHAEALVKISNAAGEYAPAHLKAQKAGLKPPTE